MLLLLNNHQHPHLNQSYRFEQLEGVGLLFDDCTSGIFYPVGQCLDACQSRCSPNGILSEIDMMRLRCLLPMLWKSTRIGREPAHPCLHSREWIQLELIFLHESNTESNVINLLYNEIYLAVAEWHSPEALQPYFHGLQFCRLHECAHLP